MGASAWLWTLTGLLAILYFWIKHHYSYWRRRNIPSIEPNPIFGNLKEAILMKKCCAEHFASLYNHKNAQGQPVVGIHIFNKPALIIRDLELIKLIMIKDFNKFSNRFMATDPHGDALGAHNLFFVKNPQWKELRTKLTPVFTTGKLKQMFSHVAEVGCNLDDYLCNLPLDDDTKPTNSIKELKELCALFTTDVISSVAFGVRANSLKDPNSEFRKNGRTLFALTLSKALQFMVIFFLPKLVGLFRCKTFSTGASKFMRQTINFIMDERIKSGMIRNDLIDTLVAFKHAAEAEGDKEVTNDMLVAQAALFFAAGFETTSTTISFGLYELSKKPEIQKRLREEIRTVLSKNNGKITYESLGEMEYLHMVVQEVMRLYPSLPFLDRECTLGKGEDGYSLKPFCDFSIPNGMPVFIPTFAIQRDPKLFTNPLTFDPERFSAENKANILPNSYMPFGIGPHNCIGERLGIIQAKVGFISFLKNHSVTTCDQSQKEIKMDPKGALLSAEGGIFCKLIRDPLVIK